MIPSQVDKARVLSIPKYVLTVCPFQGRGGDNGWLRPLSQRQDELPKGIEPRGTILIGQWDSQLHLFDIGRRVEVISIVKLPT